MNIKNNKLGLIISLFAIISIGLYFVPRVFFIKYFVLFGFFYLAYSRINNKRLKTNIVKASVIIICIAGVIYSAIYNRELTFDSFKLYFSNVVAIADHLKLAYFERPPLPYLGELIYALIFKLSSIRILNVALFIISLVDIYLMKLFLRQLGKISDATVKSSLFIAASSPTFIFLAISEFKIEPVLLLFALLCYLAFCKYIDTKNIKFALCMALLGGLSILIKTSTTPVFVLLILFSIFEAINIKTDIKKKLSKIVIILSSAILPILLWLLIFGNFTFISSDILSPIFGTSFGLWEKGLERNKTIFNECVNQDRINDFKSYFSASTPTGIFSEYVLRGVKARSEYEKVNPGILIYLGIILVPFIPIIRGDLMINRKFIYFYLTTLIFTLYYLFFIKTVFWYLLILFPIYALVLPSVLEILSNYTPVKLLLKISIHSLSMLYIFISVVLSFTYLALKPYPEVTTTVEQIYQLNYFVNSLHNQDPKLVLDASARANPTFLTFVANHDQFVIPDRYYFVASDKSLFDIYSELKSKNIGYIIFNHTAETTPKYSGCPMQNIVLVKEFISKYTSEIYSSESGSVYRLLEL